MKGKQLLLLLVLVAGLGYAGWLAFQGNRESWSQTGKGGAGTKVLELPINDVAQVQLKTATGEVNLVKGDDWTVKERGDYPANFEQVSELLRKVWDLKTVQAVPVGPSQLGRLELLEPGKGDPAGTLLDLKDKEGKSLASLLLGKKQMRKSEGGGGMGDDPGFAVGRYVMPMGDKARVSLVSETFDQYEPKPERWLRKDFVKVENPKTITMTGTAAANNWMLTRESTSAEWKLADAKPDEKLDTSKVSMFGSAFSSPSFKDVLAPDAKPADTGLDKPTTLKIETTDGFTYMIETGKATDDGYPVRLKVSGNFAKERTPGKDEKPEDKTKLDDDFKAAQKKLEDKLAAEKKFESRIYQVEKYSLESLLKERTALLAEKKPEPAPAAPGAAVPPPIPGAPPLSPAARAPITVTTPPISVPEATSPPVPVPAEPKPMPVPTPQPPPPRTPTDLPPPPKNTPPAPPANPAPESPAKPAPTPEPPTKPAPEPPAKPAPQPAPPAPSPAPPIPPPTPEGAKPPNP